MRKVALALSSVVLFAFASCNNATSKIANNNESGEVNVSLVDGEGSPKFSFEEESFHFGEIEEGVVAKHDFKFTNTGDAPLIITNAQGSCGCTVPQWPNEPIAPGESGVIHVEFNSQSRTGAQTKEVRLTANTSPSTYVLSISASVIANPETAAAQQAPTGAAPVPAK